MKRLLIALVFFALCGGAVTDGPAQILLRAGVFATGGGLRSGTSVAVGSVGQSMIGRSTGSVFASCAGKAEAPVYVRRNIIVPHLLSESF